MSDIILCKDGVTRELFCECDEGHKWKPWMVDDGKIHCLPDSLKPDDYDNGRCSVCGYYKWYIIEEN